MPVNLVTNPSFAAATTGWSAGGGTLTRVASAGAAGVGHARVSSTTGATQLSLNGAIPLDASVTVVSGRVSAKSTNITGQSLRVGLWFLDSGGAVLAPQEGVRKALSASWQSWTFENVAVPAGAVSMRIEPIVVTNAGAAYVPTAAGRTLDVDAAIVSPSATVPDYFDGATPGAFWFGAANASRSGLMRPYLAPESNAPRVEIVFDALPANVATVTLTAVSGGRSRDVRGAISKSVAGSLVHTDFEAPPGAAITYRAALFDGSGGPVGFTLEGVVTVPDTAPDDGFFYAWLHNPLDPAGATRVAVQRDALGSIRRTHPGRVDWAQGRALGLASASRRHGLSSVPLHLVTETREQAERLDAMFGSDLVDRYPVLCVRLCRGLGHVRLPDVWFAGILATEYEPDVSMGTDQTVWRFTADQVVAPVPALVIPLLRRRDLDAFYASRQAMDADNASRFSLSRRYDLAGAGG
jgi:hypothetical protein